MAATDQEVIDFYNSVSIIVNADIILYHAIVNKRPDVIANVKPKLTTSLSSIHYLALVENFDQASFDALIQVPEEFNLLYINALQSSRANYELTRSAILNRDPTYTFPRIMDFILDFATDIDADIDYYSAFPEFADVDWEQAADDVFVNRPGYIHVDKVQRARDKGRNKPKPQNPRNNNRVNRVNNNPNQPNLLGGGRNNPILR